MEGKLVEVPEGTPGAKWVDDDLWATGRLQKNYNKPRKSFAELDEAKLTKDARKQAHEARVKANAGKREQALEGRKEAIEKLKQIDQPLENTTKSRAGHGHGHKDHGYQTRLEDHRKRIETGKSPSGRRGKGNADLTSSAKFYSPEAEIEALQKAEQKLRDVLQKGEQPTMMNGQPNRIPVTVTSDHPRGFGGGYKPKVDAQGRGIPHPNGGYQAEPVKKIGPSGFRVGHEAVIMSQNDSSYRVTGSKSTSQIFNDQ